MKTLIEKLRNFFEREEKRHDKLARGISAQDSFDAGWEYGKASMCKEFIMMLNLAEEQADRYSVEITYSNADTSRQFVYYECDDLGKALSKADELWDFLCEAGINLNNDISVCVEVFTKGEAIYQAL